MAEQKSAAEKKAEEVMPLAEPAPPPDRVDVEAAKIVPKEGDDGYDTPSGYALAEVGKPSKAEVLGEDLEKARQRGLEYRVQKFMKRWLG